MYEMTAANTAMFSSAATIFAPSVVLLEDEDEDGDRVADDRARDQRDVRGLALAVRPRQELREVAGPRQRVRVPAVGVDDREEARDQPDHEQQPEEVGDLPARPKIALKPSRSGNADLP